MVINLLENKIGTQNNYIYKQDGKEFMWAELEHLEWIIDWEKEIAVSRNILMAGINFNNTLNYNNFENTNLYRWLNTEFVNVIMMFEDYKLINIDDLKDENIGSKLFDNDVDYFSKKEDEKVSLNNQKLSEMSTDDLILEATNMLQNIIGNQETMQKSKQKILK